MKLLVGCDPELFLQRDGKFWSGWGLVRGTKERPFKVDKGAVQVDGMALEFNIEPASTKEEFLLNVSSVMDTLASMVPEYQLSPSPVAEFDLDHLESQPREALALGCDPDYNAYSGEGNPRPDGTVSFRTGAGHVHIGWTEGQDINDSFHKEMCKNVVKELDLLLGLPSLFLDKDTKRKELYGKAGALRYKPYGVEYRVLSNFWLESEELIDWVYEGVQKAIDNLSQGVMLSSSYPDIEQVINTNNKERAMQILDEVGVSYD